MKSLTEEALGGLSAGVVGTVIGYPLDAIKTQLQTSKASSGIFATGAHIVRREGVLSLYRGMVPPLLSLSILNTLSFSSYSYLQRLYGARRGAWDWKNAAAGATVGSLASVVSTVENLIKTQMQVDRGSSQNRYSSSWDCFKQLVNHKKQPIPGAILYTGHAVNTAREVTFLLTYFYMYEGLRTELGHTTSPPRWVIPAAGGLSGAIAWAVSFPLDCVRAGVQGRRNLFEEGNAWQVFRKLLATKGLRGLYAGVSPSIVRAFIVSGTRFSAYEGTLGLLRGGRDMF
jgi:solute carrier family 25 carnitine/acylcarnitine transporter 20/29